MSKLMVFGATWCGPCKVLKAELNSLLTSAELTIDVEQIDIDEQEELVDQMEIVNVPTTIFIKDGKEVERFVGTSNFGRFLQRCKGHLALDNACA